MSFGVQLHRQIKDKSLSLFQRQWGGLYTSWVHSQVKCVTQRYRPQTWPPTSALAIPPIFVSGPSPKLCFCVFVFVWCVFYFCLSVVVSMSSVALYSLLFPYLWLLVFACKKFVVYPLFQKEKKKKKKKESSSGVLFSSPTLLR